MNSTPNELSRCTDLGMCVMDPYCHRRFECAVEVRDLPRDLPTPTGAPGDADLLALEGWMRRCWAIFCAVLGGFTCGAVLWLLWHFDAPLRELLGQAASNLADIADAAFWAWAAQAL